MTYADYHAAQALLEEKAKGLMNSEGKPIAKTGFPMENYTVYPIAGRIFYVAAPNAFRHIILKNVLTDAVTKHPALFGTGNALDVVEAIRLVEPSFDNTARHAEFLQNEQFGFVMENKNGVTQEQVLRIDLFRNIKPHLITGKPDFEGGLLHAFDHFSYNGVNLSTGNEMNDLVHPEKIISLAIKAFFMPEEIDHTNKGFDSRITLSDKHWLQFSFYLEKNTRVHFINTAHIKAKKTGQQQLR